MLNRVSTPCIGVCSTGLGDDVCRGCKRFAHEVIDWNAYSEQQRRVIEARLSGYLRDAVCQFFVVDDVNRLRQQLEHQGVRFKPHQDPHCWAFDLMRAGASQLGDLSDYGLRLTERGQGVSLGELRKEIDDAFYAVSAAYYQRYVAPGLEPV